MPGFPRLHMKSSSYSTDQYLFIACMNECYATVHTLPSGTIFFSIHDSTKTRCNEYGVLGICGQNRLFFQLFQSHARDNSCQLVGRSGVFHFPTTRDSVVIPDHNFKMHIRHSVSLWITKCKLPLSNPTRLQPSSVGHKVLLLEFQRLA